MHSNLKFKVDNLILVFLNILLLFKKNESLFKLNLLLLIILLALGPIASQIPAAVLAGILITVGIGVMDYKGLKAVPLMPRPEVMIMIVVLILSSVWNLVYAVGIGLVISSLIFMKKMGDLTNDNSSVLK